MMKRERKTVRTAQLLLRRERRKTSSQKGLIGKREKESADGEEKKENKVG